MRYFKRGDDFDFVANRVRSGKNGTLLPAATLTWRLAARPSGVQLDGAGPTPGAGNMTQYDVNTASWDGSVPRAVTAAAELFGDYVLEIIITNAGRVSTVPMYLKAVDVLPEGTP